MKSTLRTLQNRMTKKTTKSAMEKLHSSNKILHKSSKVFGY